jgi:hypothetical protein
MADHQRHAMRAFGEHARNIRTAHTAGRDPQNDVTRNDFRLWALFDSDVTGGMKNSGTHDLYHI